MILNNITIRSQFYGLPVDVNEETIHQDDWVPR